MAAALQGWQCTRCTFENPEGSGQCEMCGQMRLLEPRPPPARPAAGDASPSAVPWRCMKCTFENPAGSTSCEMCANARIEIASARGTGSSAAALSPASEKRRKIIEAQLRNKAAIDAEVVTHFKEQEQHRGLVTEPFECCVCFDDVESGIQCAPGHADCEHKMCTPCLVRLAEGQIERKEPLVCPMCPATRPAQIPSWLVGLVVNEAARARLVEIEQLHLNQVGGGTLRLWQCPTPDCSNRLALDPDWDARIDAKRHTFGIGVAGARETAGGAARGAGRGRTRGRGAARSSVGILEGPGTVLGGLMGAAPAVGRQLGDEAFTASSQRDSNCAYSARLRDPAGWLPFGEENGWLMVDLGEDVRLVGLAIQGGFLGTVSILPSGCSTDDWIPCTYIVPQVANLDNIMDIEFPPVVARFLRFDAENFVGESGLRFEVYSTDAPEGVVPLTEQERVVMCTACQKKICVRCMVEEHAGFTCDAFARWKEENETGERAYADMVAQGLIKPCPNCAAPILKNEGCNFMSCPTCNDENRMCWETGKKRYGPDGCGGGHNCH
eukprot:gnl/TRDRNA2_/TRDRNA2_29139_c0_seq1.p1 gnl/TRDRNA2_/TRDRNA2_29139_c0~~gnl/TRDRNA2_/TRDRNA2_29139_c0_seq1.p1  ORF type:complete len:565 (+),score=57.27 gnl/TRDRNA2_/TRDRNA2_29139_c0_seq1:39-1697(+)